MPVILEREHLETWMRTDDLRVAAGLMKPAGEDVLQRRPVSRRVNNSKAPTDDPTLIEEVKLAASADDTVLEIGTGLGYQAAILAQLARKVYSIEIIEELGRQARQQLHRQGCTNIELKIANGYRGWSEHAPFDKVIVTAAPDLIPPPLIHQLKAGGKMVVPAGLPDAQQLVLVEKHGNYRVTTREILQVRFSQLEDTEPG